MPRKVIYREVPKPPGPSGEISEGLWIALKERSVEEYHIIQVIYLDETDIDWLDGYAAGVNLPAVNDQVYNLVQAIKKLGQVEVTWITE